MDYDIEVTRVGPGNMVSIKVDGEIIEGTLIPTSEKKQVQVAVMVG